MKVYFKSEHIAYPAKGFAVISTFAGIIIISVAFFHFVGYVFKRDRFFVRIE